MSDIKTVKISFRESTKIDDSLSAIADQKGLTKSSVLRMMIREQLKSEADSAK